ncbi:MAG: TOTE conflict system archaeo-eukaryotic primase domain-containing protein, partial [Vitreoscilla sp.]
EGEPLSWKKKPKIEVFVEPRKKQAQPLADISALTPGALALNDKAKAALEPFLSRFGQLLEMDCEGEPRWFYNVTNVVSCRTWPSSKEATASRLKAGRERPGAMNERELLATLQAENARLTALLESHGIAWRLSPTAPSHPTQTVQEPAAAPEPQGASLSTADKVAPFRRLFRGRTDVYPVRWESKTLGKSGYAPACANEWRPGIHELAEDVKSHPLTPPRQSKTETVNTRLPARGGRCFARLCVASSTATTPSRGALMEWTQFHRRPRNIFAPTWRTMAPR